MLELNENQMGNFGVKVWYLFFLPPDYLLLAKQSRPAILVTLNDSTWCFGGFH